MTALAESTDLGEMIEPMTVDSINQRELAEHLLGYGCYYHLRRPAWNMVVAGAMPFGLGKIGPLSRYPTAQGSGHRRSGHLTITCTAVQLAEGFAPQARVR